MKFVGEAVDAARLRLEVMPDYVTDLRLSAQPNPLWANRLVGFVSASTDRSAKAAKGAHRERSRVPQGPQGRPGNPELFCVTKIQNILFANHSREAYKARWSVNHHAP